MWTKTENLTSYCQGIFNWGVLLSCGSRDAIPGGPQHSSNIASIWVLPSAWTLPHSQVPKPKLFFRKTNSWGSSVTLLWEQTWIVIVRSHCTHHNQSLLLSGCPTNPRGSEEHRPKLNAWVEMWPSHQRALLPHRWDCWRNRNLFQLPALPQQHPVLSGESRSAWRTESVQWHIHHPLAKGKARMITKLCLVSSKNKL